MCTHNCPRHCLHTHPAQLRQPFLLSSDQECDQAVPCHGRRAEQQQHSMHLISYLISCRGNACRSHEYGSSRHELQILDLTKNSKDWEVVKITSQPYFQPCPAHKLDKAHANAHGCLTPTGLPARARLHRKGHCCLQSTSSNNLLLNRQNDPSQRQTSHDQQSCPACQPTRACTATTRHA